MQSKLQTEDSKGSESRSAATAQLFDGRRSECGRPLGSEEYAARHFGFFFLPPETPPPPQELKSFFGIFAALNETVINTVMRVSTETVV